MDTLGISVIKKNYPGSSSGQQYAVPHSYTLKMVLQKAQLHNHGLYADYGSNDAAWSQLSPLINFQYLVTCFIRVLTNLLFAVGPVSDVGNIFQSLEKWHHLHEIWVPHLHNNLEIPCITKVKPMYISGMPRVSQQPVMSLPGFCPERLKRIEDISVQVSE